MLNLFFFKSSNHLNTSSVNQLNTLILRIEEPRFVGNTFFPDGRDVQPKNVYRRSVSQGIRNRKTN